MVNMGSVRPREWWSAFAPDTCCDFVCYLFCRSLNAVLMGVETGEKYVGKLVISSENGNFAA